MGQTFATEFAAFRDRLGQIRRLAPAHRRALPMDILDLSRILTQERVNLAHPYWSSQPAISAYLYYFLPWNILRLVPLLRGIRDALGITDQSPRKRVLLDVGSGPLTLPLALYYALPGLRDTELTIVAQDRSQQPLDLGRSLLQGLLKQTDTPWHIILCQGPLERVFSFMRQKNLPSPWLITETNLLNELCTQKLRHVHSPSPDVDGDGDADGPDEEQPSFDHLDTFLHSLAPFFSSAQKPGPLLLAVEPGTRFGGKIIQQLRTRAEDLSLTPVLPCPAPMACPLQKGAGKHTWCHFTFRPEFIPPFLLDLSREARLQKETLSLSPLLLTVGPQNRTSRNDLVCRILSAPFAVPGLRSRARYACSARGLLLVEDPGSLEQGMLLTVRLPEEPQKDSKSGALIIPATGYRRA